MPRNCNCAGGQCGPQGEEPPDDDAAAGVSRREFISLASIGAAGVALAGGAPGTAPADLAEWKASLMKPSAPRKYRSDVHRDAKMHLGGIGTGNFEIGVDGQFTTWQLFNTLRDGFVPFCFGVKAGKTAKLLQTAGGPDGLPHVKSIEMTGDYPVATLQFEDADLPVQIEMSAFTPFAPLDTEFSSQPLACFVFKLHNPGHEPQRVSLAAFMQNPVGYDAMGVPISFNSVGFNSVAARWSSAHPNFGGNFNSQSVSGDIGVLAMEARADDPPTIDQPLDVYTNLRADAFNAPYELRPSMLAIHPIGTLADRYARLSGKRNPPLVWLEDAPVDLPVGDLRTAANAVRLGATLVFSGKAMPLLAHYAEITGGKPLDRASLRPDIVFEDFEGGYDRWTVTGTAFGERPASGTLEAQQQVSGFLGHGLVNSFRNGDDTTGKMVSQPFAIERRFIKFLVGGGSSRNTQIRLVVDGRTVRAASGRNDERLLPAFWDVRDLQGRQAHIEIVDNATGGWGHINVDQIEFGDLPGSVETLELLDEILPARFAAVRPVPAAAGAPEHVTFQGLAPRTGAAEQRSKSGRAAVAGSLGAGRVILDAGPILDPDHIELVGARAAAYRALASTVGAQIKGGEGVPAGAPGMGSVAIGVKGGSQGFDLAFTDWTAAWSKFAGAGLKPATEADPMLISHPTAMGRTCCGAVGTEITVAPGKTVETPFVVAWRYPNKYSSRGENMGCHYAPRGDQDNAGLIARRAIMRFAALRSRTERFRSVFYDSSLPHWMLDAITSQVATLRHIGVVFRIGNGDFYGWEGSNGCCDPTCTHVWGYVQNAARVFPAIERDMRRIDFKHQQGPDGGVHNRTEVPSPPRPTGERPFTDGHCSCILKAYREALNTEGDAFFKEYWPNVRHAVQYMIDRDAATSNGTPNGLIEDDQWNTYDEALHGVTSFIGTYYLAALRAGEEWAKRAGDRDSAARFRSVYELGRKNLVDRCWNGEYFRQDLPGYEKRGGEVGPGCMADQLIGQWWAHQLGLGYLLPEDKVKAALAAVFKYNWMPDLTGWRHSPRAFAGASDKGLIICTWPKGGRPPNVMLYSDEVWTGVEYQVAAHMLYEGMIEEGFAIVKGVRDRYDGVPRAPIPRNPWNEIECGGHYARAGSSWSLLLAASGWRYDGERRELELKPRTTPAAFKAMFTGPEAWGSVVQSRKGGAQRNELTVVEGRLEIASLKLAATGGAGQVKVALGAQAVTTKTSASGAEVVLQFASPVTIVAGQTLTVKVS